MARSPTIAPLKAPVSDAEIVQLAGLLLDAVASGAAVSFLHTLTLTQAQDWWKSTLDALPSRGAALSASDDVGIVGVVLLLPAWAPNQPHRADVCKLMVHRRARGQGLGTRLMQAVEAHARQSGFRLLTLDAKAGGAAEALYTRLGWVRVGSIPDYALDIDGTTLHDTVVFYRKLDEHASPQLT